MTLTQLEYIIAVDTYRSFNVGADKCCVTQPTLSMQIKKLEDELGAVLFDRSKQPVIATEIGREIIDQARIILKESSKIDDILKARNGEVQGKLRIGIIPTIAPYLLPLFLNKFLKKFPNVKISIEEIITESIIQKLKNDQLDCGILVSPSSIHSFESFSLFYEPFVAYVSETNCNSAKKTLEIMELDLTEIWILNDGHCMRSQVENLCFGNLKMNDERQFQYESGGIETLKRLVENNNGFTILPELSISDFTDEQMERVRYFKTPEPAREVSLITLRNQAKKTLINQLKQEVLSVVPEKMKIKDSKALISI